MVEATADGIRFYIDYTKNIVRGDIDAALAQLRAVGLKIRGGYEELKRLAAEGVRWLNQLNDDPHTRRILVNYFVGLKGSISDVDRQTLPVRVVTEFGLEVVLTVAAGLATAGVGAVVNVGRKVGQFAGRVIELLIEIIRLMRRMAAKHIPAPGPAGRSSPPAGAAASNRSALPRERGIGAATAGASAKPARAGGLIPPGEYAAIRARSVHNPDAATLLLGKYTPTMRGDVADWSTPGPDSYVALARKEEATYFDLGTQWDEIKTEHGLSDEEMFKAFNVPVLDTAVAEGKTIKFSHDPRAYRGAIRQEWDYLKSRHGYTRLVEDGGFWYAR